MNASQARGNVVGRIELELLFGEFLLVSPPGANEAAVTAPVVFLYAGEEEFAFLALRGVEGALGLELGFAELVAGSTTAGTVY